MSRKPVAISGYDAVVIVTSDWHKGTILTTWPESVLLPNGSKWPNNKVQNAISERWNEFWQYARDLAKGRKVVVIVNGDICENVFFNHHFPSGLVTLNREYHRRAAVAEIENVRKPNDIWIIGRGTPVHDGDEGQDAETIAREIGCKQNEDGTYSQYIIKININDVKMLFAHRIGTTTSPVSETTALTSMMVRAARATGLCGAEMPDIMGFAHRHVASAISISGHDVFVTPAWVAHGEFSYGIEPVAPAQIGGTVILINKDGSRYIFHKNWSLPEKGYEKL